MATDRAPDSAVVRAVRGVLAGVGDPARALAQQAYLKSVMPHRGITSPELRALLRPILRDPLLAPTTRAGWAKDVRTLWDGATHREERYAAIAL
ncbi:MAG: DNA alkylation repair protein, partial [Ornithinibacter sp.]